jgi:hypothetical protein
MAALRLVQDAAEQSDVAATAALAAAVLPHLAPLLRQPEPLLQSDSLRAAAALLSACLEAGAVPMAVDGSGGAGRANGPANGVVNGSGGEGCEVAPLLSALKSVLDVGGRERAAAEAEEAALDAGKRHPRLLP